MERSKWLKRALTVEKQIERYAAFGFLTRIEDYQKDDQAIGRAIDRLYETQRAGGLAGDTEFDAFRGALRDKYKAARNLQAPASRASHYEGAANRLGPRKRPSDDYDRELQLARAKGKL